MGNSVGCPCEHPGVTKQAPARRYLSRMGGTSGELRKPTAYTSAAIFLGGGSGRGAAARSFFVENGKRILGRIWIPIVAKMALPKIGLFGNAGVRESFQSKKPSGLLELL